MTMYSKLLSVLTLTLSFASYSAEVTKIMHKQQSSIGWEARVTLKIPESIAIESWARCNYFGDNTEIIASTHHVVKERVPTWTVKADYKKIKFVICSEG